MERKKDDGASTSLELRHCPVKPVSENGEKRKVSTSSVRKGSEASVKNDGKRTRADSHKMRTGLNSGETSHNGGEVYDAAKAMEIVSKLNRDTFDTPVLESKPPNYLWLALCTTIFFNPLFGIVALVMAIQADNEYIHGNTAKCKRLGKIVKILSIVSITLTIIVIVIISIVFNI